MSGTIPIRTLVVDDSEFFAEMTADTLREDHGIETRAETNVEDALSVLAEESIDCVVSDYAMPDRDGLEFLSAVRDRYGDLPFILLTGRGDETIASEAIEMGVSDYLLKLKVVEDRQYGRLANQVRKVVTQYRTRRKHELLVENAPDAIAHVDADGQLLAVNPALASMVDDDPRSLEGERIQSVLGEVGQERLSTGRDAIEGDVTTTSEDRYDGRRYHNIFVPVDARTDRESFQMLSRDVTERIERERELRQQNERLETFASVVSHDLRNPLTVALSSLELVQRDCDVDPEIADRMDRSLTRMEHIITDVLALARQGKADHEPKSVPFDGVLDSAWENVDAPAASIEVDVARPIEADPDRLQELLERLLENACEHAGPDVSVRVGSTADGFYIADDGEGIPSEDRETIFELGHSTSRTGSGMGLSIVEQIASDHDWTVTVTDSEAGGARIEITGVTFTDDSQ